MTREEEIAMEQYGITYEQKTIFTFEGHKYERLADAIKYAQNAVEKDTPLESGE